MNTLVRFTRKSWHSDRPKAQTEARLKQAVRINASLLEAIKPPTAKGWWQYFLLWKGFRLKKPGKFVSREVIRTILISSKQSTPGRPTGTHARRPSMARSRSSTLRSTPRINGNRMINPAKKAASLMLQCRLLEKSRPMIKQSFEVYRSFLSFYHYVFLCFCHHVVLFEFNLIYRSSSWYHIYGAWLV